MLGSSDKLVMTAPIVITGRAYQRRATLEVQGEALTWRALRGQLHPSPENIATARDEVRDVTWLEKRWNVGALVLAALSIVWVINENVAFGAITFAIATALVTWRHIRPRYWLGLDLGTRWLVLRVDRSSAGEARALAVALERRRLTGAIDQAPIARP